MSKSEMTDAAAATTATDINKNDIETIESIHKPSNGTDSKGKDKAAAFLASNERIGKFSCTKSM